jgi:hypothetical protein
MEFLPFKFLLIDVKVKTHFHMNRDIFGLYKDKSYQIHKLTFYSVDFVSYDLSDGN